MNKRWEKKIRQLQTKKFRRQYQQFLAEGSKMVLEALDSDMQIEALFYTEKFAEQYGVLLKKVTTEVQECTEDILKKMGTLQTNEGALAIVNMPSQNRSEELPNFSLLLNQVRDPGNLGTILRIADWFAIPQIICSNSTVDVYNPKVVSASMGSIFRVPCFYEDLDEFLAQHKGRVHIFGAFMEGDDFIEITPQPPAFLIMGNESNGIRDELLPFITQKVSIPRYGEAESLNVAMATGILSSHFSRMLRDS